MDGALGMAYGVVSSTVLLSFGVPPAHYHRNIDWKLFWQLAPFGILGGCLGAFVLTSSTATWSNPMSRPLWR